ncbi:hypothetical protein [Nocardia sp. NPDC003979]
MAGLLAARVLSDAYDRVTVVERDRLDATAGARRGVPQGKHVHVLLPSGSRALETLFPGLLAELVAHNTKTIEDYTDFYFSIADNRLCPQMQPNVTTYLPTRPHLEDRIRQRVLTIPSVGVADAREAARCLFCSRRCAEGHGIINWFSSEAMAGRSVDRQDPKFHCWARWLLAQPPSHRLSYMFGCEADHARPVVPTRRFWFLHGRAQ